jgi:hypothetical protein
MTKHFLLIALLATAVACDPYEGAKTAKSIIAVTVVDFPLGDGFSAPYSATQTAGAWAVTMTCADLCTLYNDTTVATDGPGDYTDLSNLAVFVTFDGQLNGDLVQTAVDDCTPNGGWLTPSPAAGTGGAWYSCYTPSSPASYEGGSAVLFVDGIPPVDEPIGGWGNVSGFDPGATIPGTGAITLNGTLSGIGVDVTINRVDTAACAVCTD